MVDGRNSKREDRMTAAFKTVAVIAALGAVKNAAKIINPLDPLGLPKLPFRLAKVAGFAAIAAAAGAVSLSRDERGIVKDKVRECMTPGRVQRPTGMD